MLPPSYQRTLGHAERIELASDRPIRERNKVSYRVAHWPDEQILRKVIDYEQDAAERKKGGFFKKFF